MRLFKNRTARLALAVLAFLALGAWSANSQVIRLRQLKRPDRSAPRLAKHLRTERARPSSGHAADRVLVKMRAGMTEESAAGILSSYQLTIIRHIPQLGLFVARTPQGVTPTQILSLLRQNPDVARAGFDYRVRMTATPNDTFFIPYQYNLYNHGIVLDIAPDVQPQTKSGADIKAKDAWDETKGLATVVIGILDTGIDMTHPELMNKFVSRGRDFVNNDDDATDDNGHGTHVAGIAAAETNNNEGIAGVAWMCKVLPVKVLDAEGNGLDSDVIDGIVWAVDNGAKVINLSLGGDVNDPALEDACRYAFEKNVVIAAATGNDGGPVLFPAAYDSYVIAVGATDYNDEYASFSNLGPQVDVAAPGVEILGPIPLWLAGPDFLPYAFGTGTSAATPHVSGMAALLLSDKSWLKPSDIMKIIRYTADDVNKTTDPGKDDFIGYGRINMTRALVPYRLAPLLRLR